MELVEQDQFPCPLQRRVMIPGILLLKANNVVNGAFGIGDRFLALRRQRERDGVKELGIAEEELRFTIATLVPGLAGVSAPVELEIKLADPHGGIFGIELRLLEEPDGFFL